MKLRIGTRASPLALKQVEIFCSYLYEKFSDINVEIIKITTTGDKILDKTLYEIGGKALFLKELEEALLNNQIDIAIHSGKDVPAILDDAFDLCCYLKRESPHDVLISKTNIKLIKEMQNGQVIGTSAPRRIAQIYKLNPHLEIKNIRGNIQTRINKFIEDNSMDAIILASAGLDRMDVKANFRDLYYNVLPIDEIIPAACQGTIVAQKLISRDDLNFLNELSDKNTVRASLLERNVIKLANGSCKTPIGVYVNGKNAYVGIANDDFSNFKSASISFESEDAIEKFCKTFFD
jgi:hydroxymethylbilane synthase